MLRNPSESVTKSSGHVLLNPPPLVMRRSAKGSEARSRAELTLRKDIDRNLNEVLLSWACLSALAPGFLGKVLQRRFFRDPIFLSFLDLCICYPDGAQPSSIIRCRAFTSTSSEG